MYITHEAYVETVEVIEDTLSKECKCVDAHDAALVVMAQVCDSLELKVYNPFASVDNG